MKNMIVVIIILSLLVLVGCSNQYEETPENPVSPPATVPSTEPATVTEPQFVDVYPFVVYDPDDNEFDAYLLTEKFSGYMQIIIMDNNRSCVRFNTRIGLQDLCVNDTVVCWCTKYNTGNVLYLLLTDEEVNTPVWDYRIADETAISLIERVCGRIVDKF